jgi:hypothetical protein
MTNLRGSQLASIAVAANPAAGGLRASQLASIAVASNPAAIGLRVSQLCTIAVIANNEKYQSMGPVIDLGCWTPCSNLMFNGVD